MSVTSTMARRRLDVADWGCELPPEVVDLIFGFADLDLLMALGAVSKGFYQLGRAHWLRLLRAEVAAIVDGRDQRGVLERAIADGIASLRSRPPTEDGGGSSGGGGGDVLVEPDDVVEWVLALETHPAFVDGLPLRRFSVIPALLGDETAGLVDHDETLDGETVVSFVRDLRRNRNVFDPITLAYGALRGIPRRLRRTFRASDSRDLQRSGTLVQHLTLTGKPFAILEVTTSLGGKMGWRKVQLLCQLAVSGRVQGFYFRESVQDALFVVADVYRRVVIFIGDEGNGYFDVLDYDNPVDVVSLQFNAAVDGALIAEARDLMDAGETVLGRVMFIPAAHCESGMETARLERVWVEGDDEQAAGT